MLQKRIFTGSFIQDNQLNDLFYKVQFNIDKTGKFKWTRTPENLHITFHFFGDMLLGKINKLQTVLSDVLNKEHHINIEMTGLDFFTRKAKPSILYAGIKPNEALKSLYHQIQDLLYKHHFIQEKNNKFVPHITLARIKHVTPEFYKNLESFNQSFNPIIINNIKVDIIESVLEPEGALYRAV